MSAFQDQLDAALAAGTIGRRPALTPDLARTLRELKESTAQLDARLQAPRFFGPFTGALGSTLGVGAVSTITVVHDLGLPADDYEVLMTSMAAVGDTAVALCAVLTRAANSVTFRVGNPWTFNVMNPTIRCYILAPNKG